MSHGRRHHAADARSLVAAHCRPRHCGRSSRPIWRRPTSRSWSCRWRAASPTRRRSSRISTARRCLVVQHPNFFGLLEPVESLSAQLRGGRRAARGVRRSAVARGAQAAGRLRRGHRGRRGAVAREPRGLRRAAPGLHVDPARARPTDARAHHRGHHRHRGAARLRDDAPDARAAHPPREGHVEHLHEPGARRARRGRLPVAARGERAPRARRAASTAKAHYAAGGPRRGRRGRRFASTGPSSASSSSTCPCRAAPASRKSWAGRHLAGHRLRLLLRRHGERACWSSVTGAAHAGRTSTSLASGSRQSSSTGRASR